MPLLIRLVIFIVVGFVLGAVVPPALWASVVVKQSTHILSPFMILSSAILIASVGYAWAQLRKKP